MKMHRVPGYDKATPVYCTRGRVHVIMTDIAIGCWDEHLLRYVLGSHGVLRVVPEPSSPCATQSDVVPSPGKEGSTWT
jgi:hypothetical protein